MLQLKQQLGISIGEINRLGRYIKKTADGRINYNDFFADLDNEKKELVASQNLLYKFKNNPELLYIVYLAKIPPYKFKLIKSVKSGRDRHVRDFDGLVFVFNNNVDSLRVRSWPYELSGNVESHFVLAVQCIH